MSEYRALYRKYRPTDFDDVCGQGAITDILKYQVASGKISHAYLFCSSRGTGKTSCAKILAKAVNCENPKDGNPCNCCAACRSIDQGFATDVIEMDAASNNGVGNVRDMKDEIAFTPAELKYRVYIIDEVHMMSASAFNALLKTLEEPPAYVVFILATTEFHKLPTTIVSRCQRYDFRRMTADVIVERLKKISKLENIDLTDGGAAMLARVAEGGMRDAVSLLELCAGSRRTVDEDLVFATVGRGSRTAAYTVMEALLSGSLTEVYSYLSEVIAKGIDISVFWGELIDAYRDLLVVKGSRLSRTYLDLTDTEYERLAALAKDIPNSKLIYHTSVLEATLADLQRARESKRSIAEIALAKLCDARLTSTPEALVLRIEELEREVSRLKLGAPAVSSVAAPLAAEEASDSTQSAPPKVAPAVPIAPAQATQDRPYKNWSRVIAKIETLGPSIYTPLTKAVAQVLADGSYLIKVDAFFVRIISDIPENVAIIKGSIAEVEGTDASAVRVSIVKKDQGDTPTLADELEDAIGGAD
ncbi:MAG: DNA polymerase III subunit gamma/tau [Clostridia bacterium]|nr:DNA polymerase III subunit gamma/tau [Clostridia bacterium]